jgi:Flp pilus assembly protein TadD
VTTAAPSTDRAPVRPPSPGRAGRRLGALAAALGLAVLALYWRVGGYGFVNFDDGDYVAANPALREGLSWKGIAWAFTTFHGGNWHPLTWLSHLLDYRLFGLSAGGPHLENVLLHAASSIALLLVLRRLTGALWRSCAVAALFALHPLRVESVAWVAQRKDVLGALFWVITLGAYARYAARASAGRYAVVALTFALGLLCKPTLVTLPLALLLLDFWPLGRFRGDGGGPAFGAAPRLVREKIPLLLLSLGAGAATLYAPYRLGILTSTESLPLVRRVVVTISSYGEYLAKTLWPAGLAVIYPIRDRGPWWLDALGIALVAGVSWLLVAGARRRPAPAAGWIWFLLVLLPMSPLVHIGFQDIADRYTYLPHIGLFMGVAWWAPPHPAASALRRRAAPALVAAALAGCFLVSWRQVGFWSSSVALFERAHAVTEDDYVAHVLLASVLAQEGRLEAARENLEKALAMRPGYAEAHGGLGVVLERGGQQAAARARYLEALRLDPGYADARWNLGHLLARMGLAREAAEQFRRYLRERPEDPAEFREAAATLLPLDAAEAAKIYRMLVAKYPDDAEGHHELGVALAGLGRQEEALGHFQRAAELAPGSAATQYNLAATLERLGWLEQAAEHYRWAIALGDGGGDARARLDGVLARMRESAGEARPGGAP